MEFLSALGQREALAFGDGVALPVRIKFDELPADVRPRSSTAAFSAHWQHSVGDEGFLEQIVEKWRSAVVASYGDDTPAGAVFAGENKEQVDNAAPADLPNRPDPQSHEQQPALRPAHATVPAAVAANTTTTNGAPRNGTAVDGTVSEGRATAMHHKQPEFAGVMDNGNSVRAAAERPSQMATRPAGVGQTVNSPALKALRERLMQRQ